MQQVVADAGGADLGREPGKHWRAHRHGMSYRFAEYFRPGATPHGLANPGKLGLAAGEGTP